VATRSFRVLRWLRQPHGRLTRTTLAALAWLLVLILTGHAALAREAAALFAQDQFTTGAHRINWYLHHGWAARFMGATPPLFDPTTQMPALTVATLDSFLLHCNSPRHRLAQLYVRARQIVTVIDPTVQVTLMNDYAQVASALVAHLPRTDPEAPAVLTAGPTPTFTLKQAHAAVVALQKIAMPWYVISGTFLGAVREGTFLAHDYDIDVGVQASDFDDTTFRAQITAAPDLTLVNTSHHLDLSQDAAGLWSDTPRPALYRLLHANGVGIDVFVHYLDGDQRWHGSAKHHWNNHNFGLADYTIAGLAVRGPADADRYLTENYGDWRTPVTRFNCSTGTPNVQFPRNPAALVEHLCIALLSADPREAQIAQLILWQESYLQKHGDAATSFVFPWLQNTAPADRDCPRELDDDTETPVCTADNRF
jgi:hypothetical protein